MSFVDSLSKSTIEKERIQHYNNTVNSAISLFISDFEVAIKNESTTAARSGKNNLSGYYVGFHGGYGGNPHNGFVNDWQDSEKSLIQL